jgi:hypothetical protein
MAGSISLPMPANSRIMITGFTNTGGWGEQITIAVTEPSPEQWTWGSTGPQNNHLVGQNTIGPFDNPEVPILVSMAYDDGSGRGYQPSSVEADTFNMDGLSGYVVGGQDGGGRPNGDAYWNTLVLIYWAAGY